MHNVTDPSTHSSTADTCWLVTGATGFIGSALVRGLLAEGQPVTVLSRDPSRARALLGAGVRAVRSLSELSSSTRIGAIVNLAGAPVIGPPWTDGRRAALLKSRTDATGAVIDLLARLEERPRVMVSASAVGYYGVPMGNAPVDETAPPQPGRFQSDLCVAIEREACRAEALGVRVVRTRLGIVLGPGGGALPPLAMAARFGVGAVLGSGEQPVPWIHRDDAVALMRFSVEQAALDGAVNGVAPDIRPQREFAAAVAASFGRTVHLKVPAFVLRTALGEMSELLLAGQWAVPKAALAAGFRFRHASLESALRAASG